MFGWLRSALQRDNGVRFCCESGSVDNPFPQAGGGVPESLKDNRGRCWNKTSLNKPLKF